MKNGDFQPWKNSAINMSTPPHSGAPKGCFPGHMLAPRPHLVRPPLVKNAAKMSGMITGLFWNDLELDNVLNHIAIRNSDWVSLKRPQGHMRTHMLTKRGPLGATRPTRILDLINKTNHKETRGTTTISQHSWSVVHFTGVICFELRCMTVI